MKNTFYSIFFLFSLLACDNGDIDVPSFEFEEEIHICDDYKVLYLTNTDNTEAFILQLSNDDIAADFGVDQIAITETNTNYRVFDGAFTNDYFCSPIPPATPIVITDWKGVPGTDNYIQIETSLYLSASKIGHKHSITLHNLLLTNNDAQSILEESFEFCSFTLELEDKIHFCDDYKTLYWANNDNTEAFVIQLSPDDIVEEEGTIQIPITATNTNYRIFNGAFTNDYFCSPILPTTPTVTTDWKGVAGTDNYIQIETTLISDAIDSGYNYHITLHNLGLETTDEQSIIIENFDFGSFNIEE